MLWCIIALKITRVIFLYGEPLTARLMGMNFTVMQNCVLTIYLKVIRVIRFFGNINRTPIRIKIQPT